MTYSIPPDTTLTTPPDTTLTTPVFQCCGETYFQAPQAEYHLWRVHGDTRQKAAAFVMELRVQTWPKAEVPHD